MADDRTNKPERPRNISLPEAFKCAGKGFLWACISGRNMKIHLGVAVIAVILGFVLSIDRIGWLAVIGCIFVVIAAECFNTAIEAAVDLVSPEYDESAGRAKDCAAAAVLVLAVLSLVVAVLVYGPALLEMMG